MKRILALVLSLIMMFSCVAFAENEQGDTAAHQDYISNLLAEAGVDFNFVNLSAGAMEFFYNAAIRAHIELTSMSAEQLAEWTEVRVALFNEALNTDIGEGEALVALVDEKIDAMETFGVLSKVSLKSTMLENLVQGSYLTPEERDVLAVLQRGMYETYANADAEMYDTIYAGIMSSLSRMTFAPHDVRDDLMKLYNHIASYTSVLNEAIIANPEDASDLAYSYFYIYARQNNPLPENEAEASADILKIIQQELVAEGYDLANLTEEETAQIKTYIASYITENFASLTEEQDQKFVDFMYQAVVKNSTMAEDKHNVLRSMMDNFTDMLECADEETLAHIEEHITSMQASLSNGDYAALAEELNNLYAHTSEHHKEHLFDTLYHMTEDEAKVIAIKVLSYGWAWSENNATSEVIFERFDSLGVDWSNPSEEHLQVIEEMIVELLSGVELTEEKLADNVQRITYALTLIGNYTEEEYETLTFMSNIIATYLNFADEAMLQSVQPILQNIVSAIAPHEGSIEEAAMEGIQIFFSDNAEGRFADLSSLSESALMLICRLFVEEYEASQMFTAEQFAQLKVSNDKIKEGIAHIELKGKETDPAVIAELEDILDEVYGVYPALNYIEKAAIRARVVARLVIISTYDEAEREILYSVHTNLDAILLDASEENQAILNDLYHHMQHIMYEKQNNG
ncbi:MAG: hypothetical protein Q4A66_07720 [Eubacteriales bacterium]|nr:hypothetical protein [Eubacteriales bacterium]